MWLSGGHDSFANRVYKASLQVLAEWDQGTLLGSTPATRRFRDAGVKLARRFIEHGKEVRDPAVRDVEDPGLG